MQKMAGRWFKSGLWGHAIPRIHSAEEEELLVRWLNDDWQVAPNLDLTWGEWQTSNPDKKPFRYLPDVDDPVARAAIINKFLPLLRIAHTALDDPSEALQRGANAIAENPDKYRDIEEAAYEESGLAANAELMEILRKFSVVPTVPTAKSRTWFIAEGDNATEAWAAYLLMGMAEAGALERLAQCACHCGRWLMKVKRTDRFFADACRVRYHQSNEAFKEERRKAQRDRYRLEKDGKVNRGWKKKSGAANAKAAK